MNNNTSNSKFIGKIFEGRFKVIECRCIRSADGKSREREFTLENIYNEAKIVVCQTVFYNLLKGKTTISKIIASRIGRDKGYGR